MTGHVGFTHRHVGFDFNPTFKIQRLGRYLCRVCRVCRVISIPRTRGEIERGEPGRISGISLKKPTDPTWSTWTRAGTAKALCRVAREVYMEPYMGAVTPCP